MILGNCYTFLTMETITEFNTLKSPANGTGDREARSKRWYAVNVRSCCERKVAQKLKSLGINTYVPIQKEIRQWSDRKKIVDIILIPMIIFIELEHERIHEVNQLSFVYDFVKAPGQKQPAIIPDYQIENLMFMVGDGDNGISFSQNDYSTGKLVSICRGKLKGLSGYVKNGSNGKTKIGIVINYLGCATVEVQISDLKLM